MVYCYSCGQENPDKANFCNACGGYLSVENRFEANVERFGDDAAKFGKEVGEKAAEWGKRLAKEAQAFAAEVSKRMTPKPLPCASCGEQIYETDAFCWKCGEKRG
jgi:predicted amidophosphoribosyltransferase